MGRRARHKATPLDREPYDQVQGSSPPDADPDEQDSPLEAEGEPQFAQQNQSTPA
jgi:hypothetical protein